MDGSTLPPKLGLPSMSCSLDTLAARLNLDPQRVILEAESMGTESRQRMGVHKAQTWMVDMKVFAAYYRLHYAQSA